MANKNPLIFRIFSSFISVGQLTICLDDGRKLIAKGQEDGPDVAFSLPDTRPLYHFVRQADLAIPEAYMSGKLVLIDTSLDDFMIFLFRNKQAFYHTKLQYFLRLLSAFAMWCKGHIRRKAAKANVAHHYDLTDYLYDSFLDDKRQYSCAYFEKTDDSLEQAQLQKIARLAAKLRLRPHHKVLDIGCGWGELAYSLSTLEDDLLVKGITLSENQFSYAKDLARKRKCQSSLSFALQDYRDETGTYDHVVSVGMLEHVGYQSYQTYFDTVSKALKPTGTAVIHTIGKQYMTHSRAPFIQKYIFPGGYIPALSELAKAIEKTDLHILDIEAMHIHYAETLRHWRQRFIAKQDEIITLYDETFFRMWCFYLVSCEYFFRLDGGVVYQIQLAKSQGNSPSERSYIKNKEQDYLKKLCQIPTHSGKLKSSVK